MGDNFILRLFIIQVISILILLGIIIFLLKVSRAMKKEKRIGKFSLYAISDNDISYFENTKYGDTFTYLDTILNQSELAQIVGN